jgi:hypothetical protein
VATSAGFPRFFRQRSNGACNFSATHSDERKAPRPPSHAAVRTAACTASPRCPGAPSSW